MLKLGCMCLNQYHQLLLSIPSWNNVGLFYVNFTTFSFNWCRLMDNMYFCIAKVHLITWTSSSIVSTPPNPIFLNLVFPWRWLENEFKGMFHVFLALLNECVPLSTTSIVISNASFVHILLLRVADAQFNWTTGLHALAWIRSMEDQQLTCWLLGWIINQHGLSTC